ncbi:hypothetical protein TNCV_1277021 [Trichonephila clavipes]|nr:hypothetical protein TNCV_1277021 [Trichonephila clavipes]
MQKFLDRLQDWLTQWRIAINVDKSQAIILRKWGVIDPPFQLTIFDDNIQWVSVVRYLGLLMDSRLTYKKHIDYLSGLLLTGGSKFCNQKIWLNSPYPGPSGYLRASGCPPKAPNGETGSAYRSSSMVQQPWVAPGLLQKSFPGILTFGNFFLIFDA